MARFTVRVQLHKKDGSHHEIDSSIYSDLHTEMYKNGFTKTIKSITGLIHDLPPAEYNFVTSDVKITKYDVLSASKVAANKTKEKYSVLVTKSEEGRCWFNLDETEDSED